MIQLKPTQTSFADVDAPHSMVGCVSCHGGTEPAEFEAAHDTANGFLRDPSVNAEQFCAPCHADIVERNATSMHTNLWGEQAAIAQRQLGGEATHSDFETCPAELTDGFDSECMNCHTTCGQCHVSRPNSVNGGFIDSHRFSKTPHQKDNCMACHGSRIGVEFTGELEGNAPDLHYLKAMKCWDCHSEDLHGDGTVYESRYHVADLPTCGDCHDDTRLANSWHVMHWPGEGTGLSCYVCHSQPYNNCDNCHTDGEWKQGLHGYREYTEFRIGYNYNQELHDGKWTLVRHIPISRDSYEPWGHDELAHYDDRPTWEYTSPHNIRLVTAQAGTSSEGTCYGNCHLDGEGGGENVDLYLWRSFVDSVYSDEAESNSRVVVDDHLPFTWRR